MKHENPESTEDDQDMNNVGELTEQDVAPLPEEDLSDEEMKDD